MHEQEKENTAVSEDVQRLLSMLSLSETEKALSAPISNEQELDSFEESIASSLSPIARIAIAKTPDYTEFIIKDRKRN